MLIKMKFTRSNFLFFVIAVTATVLTKFFCAPNLALSGTTTIFGLAIFSGMMSKEKRNVFLLPLVALFFSDLIIQILYTAGIFAFAGFYSGQIVNYILLMGVAALNVLFKKINNTSIIVASILTPTVYFLISNFLVWAMGSGLVYPKTTDGLMLCYTAALPFYKNSLIATLISAPAFVVIYRWLSVRKFTIALG